MFENVRIFDGKSATLSAPSNVLVRGNKIETISTQPIAVDRRGDTRIIAGDGRTLMPGLIDNHWHAMLARTTPAEAMGDPSYNNLVAGEEATDTLMRGFTTVRDVGGPAFGLKRAIDEGIVKGPRIYPSGAMITVTSGHGDFRQLTDLPRTIGGMLTRMEQIGGAIVADSPDEGIGSPARLGLHPLGDTRQTFGLPTPADGYMAVDGTSVEAAFRRRNRSGPTMVARMMRSISVPAGRSKTSDTPWFS